MESYINILQDHYMLYIQGKMALIKIHVNFLCGALCCAVFTSNMNEAFVVLSLTKVIFR